MTKHARTYHYTYDENAKRRNNRSARPAKLVAKSDGYHTIEDQDNNITELRLFHLSEGGEKMIRNHIKQFYCRNELIIRIAMDVP